MLGSYDDDEMLVVVAQKSKLLLIFFIISIVEVIKFLKERYVVEVASSFVMNLYAHLLHFLSNSILIDQRSNEPLTCTPYVLYSVLLYITKLSLKVIFILVRMY